MSTILNKKDFNKENIKRRLKKTASEIWGYEDSDMHGFDPIADIVLGACAVEFEKIAHEISNSQTRSLDRLAQLIVPEVYTGPKPAHAVLTARPVEPTLEITKEDQVYSEKEFIIPGNTPDSFTKSIYFSPAISQKIFDASIAFVAHGKKIYEKLNEIGRHEIIETSGEQYLDYSDIWLGIRLNQKITSLKGLSFYFNWNTSPQKLKYSQILASADWSINDKKITVKSGFAEQQNRENIISAENVLFQFDISRKFESNIRKFYEENFYVTQDDCGINAESKCPYPLIFKEVFNPDDLKLFKENILWIRIHSHQPIPEQSLIEADICLNCFPALNRKLHSGRPFALEKNFNIIPLKTDDTFLSVKRVHSRDNNEYRQIPYKHLDQQAPNTYSLRKGGVGRFEKRDAKEMLKYVVELMRDESAAFKAWDDRILSKEIKLLDQNLNRLEQNILQKSSYIDSLEYLLINSNKSEDIWVEFWSTVGELGNNIIPGSKLKTSSINFKKDSIMIMNHSSGGKAKLKSSEIVYAFKSALLSRDRLVTLEDIKAACFSELGTDIKDVKVQKGIMTGLEMGQGLLRTIDITLSLAKDGNKSPRELKQLANQLKVVLESKMAAHNTLRIEFET